MNLYSTGFTKDLSQEGTAMHEADSSASRDHCLSQLSFESGFAEDATALTNKWQMNTSSLKYIHGTKVFEGAAKRTTLMGSEILGEGQIQQDDSSSSEPTVTLRKRPHHDLGKRKGSASQDFVVTTMVLESGEKKTKCLSTRVAGASASASKAQVDEEKVSPTEQQSPESEPSGVISPRSTLKASCKSQVKHPKQDYIHVRARRGQATDSHSLAERVRREKISERMKFLQDLVPGCSKVMGKAVMLDEIINYVQSLQRQIEFLSMKLAAVDPRLDINLLHLLNKEPPQARSPESILISPDTVAGHRDYQTHLQIQQINNYNVDWRSVGTFCDAYLKRSVNTTPLPHAPEAYNECFIDSQTQSLNGVRDAGDLHSIVQTSGNSRRQEFSSQDPHNFAQSLPGLRYSTTGQLKVEH